jgi:hypothetical protein
MTFANLYHHEINPREDAMHKSSLFDDWLSSYGSDTSIIMFLCSICSINSLRDSYSRVSRLNYNMNFLYYLEFFLESTKENLSFYSLSYNFYLNFFFFFLIYVGCPGQLTRTTTIPHGPLDILQAQEQVRHRGGDRRAHRGSNPERGRNKSHDWPQQLDPQVLLFEFFSSG